MSEKETRTVYRIVYWDRGTVVGRPDQASFMRGVYVDRAEVEEAAKWALAFLPFSVQKHAILTTEYHVSPEEKPGFEEHLERLLAERWVPKPSYMKVTMPPKEEP